MRDRRQELGLQTIQLAQPLDLSDDVEQAHILNADGRLSGEQLDDQLVVGLEPMARSVRGDHDNPERLVSRQQRRGHDGLYAVRAGCRCRPGLARNVVPPASSLPVPGSWLGPGRDWRCAYRAARRHDVGTSVTSSSAATPQRRAAASSAKPLPRLSFSETREWNGSNCSVQARP
jgi:hypothetical protein